VPGPVEDAWSDETRRWLQETEFTVMPQSNHVGVRLTGGAPATLPSGQGISEPQPVGAIQITPVGEAIVLGRARGTIGGYPSPATVIGADMWKFGQVRPGDIVRFELVDARTAGEEARAERERRLLMEPQRIRLRRERG
jgi:allophanate hydrolase subunit 2